MTERPILFSAPMVCALRENRKTQTRRTRGLGLINNWPDQWELKPGGGTPETCGAFYMRHCAGGTAPIICPYGMAGDRLWTRERWAAGLCAEGFKPSELAPRVWNVDNGGLWYFADGAEPKTHISPRGRWRTSLFLPRWASRDTLEVVSARPERLNAITKADALAEGIQVLPLQSADDPSAWYQSAPGVHQARSAESSYAALWNEINGPGAWAKNPWVWRVEFRRLAA